MNSSFADFGVAASLFIGMLVCFEFAFRIGLRQRKKFGGEIHGTAIESAVLGLLGLILAFAFGGASSRLDSRRQLIVQETNAIGTAYLRLDLLPEPDRSRVQNLFRQYLDARLRYYGLAAPDDSAQQSKDFSTLQKEIWSASAEARGGDPSRSLLLLPALNQTFDITTTRAVAKSVRTPTLIVALLLILALFSALVVGYEMSQSNLHSWLHIVFFALAVCATVCVVLDLDSPRSGLINLSAADQALIQLRNSMGR